MKAIVQDEYGSPDVLHLDEVDKPVAVDGKVLVRVHAAGVDAGVWHLMAGQPLLVRLMGLGMRRPKARIRGMALAGRIEAVGGSVTRFRPGDEVFGACSSDGTSDGAFAEYACAREDQLAMKPASLTFEQAAAVPVSAVTALKGLRDVARVQPGQSVLVTGAGGGVGTWAVQLAKAFGAKVTGACSTAKVDLVRSLGADHVVDSSRDDAADGSRRYDVILDTAGNRSLRHLRHALAPHGMLVIVGGEGGGRLLGGFDRQIIRAPLLSLFVSQQLRSLTIKDRTEDLEALGELIEAGKVTPVVDRTYPLAEAAEAIRYLHEGKARGKIVITV